MRNIPMWSKPKEWRDKFEAGLIDDGVTRRLQGGIYDDMKPGDHFMAVEKCQGLKKGEHVKKLGECVCRYNLPEYLYQIEKLPYRSGLIGCDHEVSWAIIETTREGFPDLTPEEFVEMFCREMSTKKDPITPESIVNRIEFVRVK